MSNFLDDEFQQMDEQEFEEELEMTEAVSINDPIRSLNPGQTVCVETGTTIAEVIGLLQRSGVSCILVTKDGALKGIFTERDVIRKLVGKGLNHVKEIVDDYMTPNPDTLRMNDPIAYALNRMYDGGFRHVPIVDEHNKPLSIISILDIVAHLAVYYSDEVLNLPPAPRRKAQTRREGG